MWIWLVGCLTSPAEYRDLYEQARDMDGDGFPSAEFGGPDCDDEDAAIFPGAGEDCDDVDQDCDGSVDEGQEFLTWYPDEDGDGWGDDAGAFDSCALEPGHVLQGEDCDDWNASVHPGQLEVCDGIDQDCDGVEDDGLEFLTWYPDGDSDGYGDDAGAIEACDVPVGHVQVAGDCDDEQTQANPGRTEVCGDGIDNDCSGGAPECGLVGEWSAGDAGVVVSSSSNFHLGWGLAAGDFDGDGADSLVLGAPDNGRGAVYLFDEPGDTTVLSTAGADWEYTPEEGYYHEVGGSLWAGDLDGDGFEDLAVGNANLVPEYGATNEYVRLFLGGSAGLGASADVLIERERNSVYFGWSVVGHEGSLAITQLEKDFSAASVYLWDVAPTSGTGAGSADVVITDSSGVKVGMYVGRPVFSDWDGDGATDLALHGERFYFFYADSLNGSRTVQDFDGSISDSSSEGQLGANGVAADLDEDGYDDFAVGVPSKADDSEFVGQVAVFLGGPQTFNNYDASDADVLLEGDSLTGVYWLEAGNVDGDSHLDLVAGGVRDNGTNPTVEVWANPLHGALPSQPHAVVELGGGYPYGGVTTMEAADGGLPWLVWAVAVSDTAFLLRGEGI
ncbi:MAG: MopE-related protein [Myxococcota bacterium]|nr:MopE-related protein [Myxococcota bacterium]